MPQTERFPKTDASQWQQSLTRRLSERYSVQVLRICQDKKIQHSSVRDDDYHCLACTSVVQYLPHAFRRCSILATKDILNKNEVSSPILKAMSLLYEDGCGCEEGISHFKSYYVFYGRQMSGNSCDVMIAPFHLTSIYSPLIRINAGQ